MTARKWKKKTMKEGNIKNNLNGQNVNTSDKQALK